MPEVVQTSAMDCGPASLKCLLAGFGIPISYARLQEACQTDVDGTSIDVIENIAVKLGLDAEQIMLPVDHVLLSDALPALIVTRDPNNMTHFLVAWRRQGPFVQLMDPAKGRRWIRCKQLLEEIYVHRQSVPAEAWRQWAGSAEFLGPLTQRIAALRLADRERQRLIRDALADPTWRGLAALDAATRMLDSLIRSGGLDRGHDAQRVLVTVLNRARTPEADLDGPVPAAYASVVPDPSAPAEQLLLQGAVLVRMRERPPVLQAGDQGQARSEVAPELSPDLVAALHERPRSPTLEIFRLLRQDGLLAPAALLVAILLAAGGVVMEALLFRSFFELSYVLVLGEQRLTAIAGLLVFAGSLLLFDLAIAGGVLRLSRRLEIRLRLLLLRKLPRVAGRYFQSRLVSDMAQRAHSLHVPRLIPESGARLVRSIVQFVLTAVGIAWLDPPSAPMAVFAAAFGLALPLAAQPVLAERGLRLRNHGATLSRVYLDGLLGLLAVRTHRAERALQRVHDGLLDGWARAGLDFVRTAVITEGVQSVLGLAVVVWLVVGYIARGGEPAGSLLLIYWALNLPVLSRDVALLARQYPMCRNVVARLLEPLGAAEENEENPARVADRRTTGFGTSPGLSITMEHVSVRVTGHTILEDINLAVRAGEHLAIVGPSGAGKSSLVGLLLGSHRPASGAILVGDRPLAGSVITELRRETAWIDPAVQLWNRSLLDNLRYGNPSYAAVDFGMVIKSAELWEILERLPEGLQSLLGEGGGLTSGGEGQRVRFGRALLRGNARLIILDEPFRGLDRARRRELLARARVVWRDATLLCVTHDVADTRAFDRALVLEGGRIVEDGIPTDLAEKAGSRYRGLLEAEEAVRTALWSSALWRRWRLDRGRLREDRASDAG